MHLREASLCVLLLAGGMLMSVPTDAAEPSNYDILKDAVVFGMCQEPRTPEDIEALAGMGVDVVVRGISCAWHATPEESRKRMASKLALRDLARKRGICFCTMITSAAIYADKQGADKLEAWASRDSKGQVIKTGSWNQGCLNDPEYRNYVKQIARAVIDGGADGIHYDEAYSRWFWMRPIPCFCDDCCAELREFIRQHHGAEKARALWGIEDLERFHYRDYLAKNGHADKPYQSPLHNVWWEMQMDSTYRYETEIVQDAKQYGIEKYGREIVVNSNPYQIATLSAAMTMESAVYDFVNIGTGFGMSFRDNGWKGARILPPRLSYVPQYKMARAHAQGKPVDMFLDIQRVPEHIQDLPPEQVDNVMQWLFAEAYASGCFFAAHHRFSQYDGPIASQQRYGSFYKRHRRLFVGSNQVANIGVAFSYPSQVWDMYAMHWDRDSGLPAHSLQYSGVCQALTDANLQYRTLFFGDGDLFPASPPEEDLDRCQVIVLPCCYAMTAAGIAAIEGYLSRGGTVLIIGDLATRDEHNEARAGPPVLGPESRVRSLDCDFEAYLSGRHVDTAAALCQALVGDIGVTPLADLPDISANIQAHCRISADAKSYVIHLINRDFAERKGFTPARDVTVEFALPAGFSAQDACALIGPDYEGGELVPAEMREIGPGRMAVVVPEISVFRAVVIER